MTIHSPRPSLAVLSRDFSSVAGGAESYAVNLALSLQAEYTITVFAQRFDASLKGFTFVPIPSAQWLPRWINQLWFALCASWLTRHYALVHSHENTACGNFQTVHVKTVHASLRERAKKRGVASTVLKVMFSPRLLAYLALERNRILGKNRTILFVSKVLQLETMQCMGRIEHCEVVTPGVHTILQGDAQLNMLAKKSDQTILLFVANDFQKKGLKVAIQALQLLIAQGCNARLLVAGKSLLREVYETQATAAGLTHRLEFLGSVRDMQTLYAQADILVHPTTQDAFGMVVLEAMARGLPCITTVAPFNAFAADLEHGLHCLLMQDPYSANELAALIKQYGNDSVLRNTVAAHGLELAKRFDWSSIAHQQHQLYQGALRKQARQPSR